MRVTLFVALILALVRIWVGFNIPPETATFTDLFKDIAHVYMGGLFMAWYLQRKSWQWKLFWAMNFLEVAVAVLSRI